MTTDLVDRLRKTADGLDREARALDNEWPEPDEYCPSAGGDGARAQAALLREAADDIAARVAARKRVEDQFGHGGIVDGKCRCPYCRGDIRDLVEMAANYEMDLFYWQSKHERLVIVLDKIKQELKDHDSGA